MTYGNIFQEDATLVDTALREAYEEMVCSISTAKVTIDSMPGIDARPCGSCGTAGAGCTSTGCTFCEILHRFPPNTKLQ